VSEKDGVLLAEWVCREERPQQEEVCMLQPTCHNSLPHTRHILDQVEAKDKALEKISPDPEADTSIWRVGDWGMVSNVGVTFFFLPSNKCVNKKYLKFFKKGRTCFACEI
jgi:hypothetical protein